MAHTYHQPGLGFRSEWAACEDAFIPEWTSTTLSRAAFSLPQVCGLRYACLALCTALPALGRTKATLICGQ
jgi:hypothetical protein